MEHLSPLALLISNENTCENNYKYEDIEIQS